MSRERRSPSTIVGLNIKIREDLRARLEQAARQNLRSLNSEVIHRMERTLIEDLKEPFTGQVAELLVTAWRTAGRMTMDATGRDPAQWRNDPEAYRESILAVATVLLELGPDGVDWPASPGGSSWGAAVARMLLEKFPTHFQLHGPDQPNEVLPGVLARVHGKSQA
jgi:Arc-like DNA binding domain